MANKLDKDILNFPLLFTLLNGQARDVLLPIISMEMETTLSKYMNGGIVNMSRNSSCGVLVTRDERPHLEFFKNRFNCNNVIFYQV